MTLQGTTDSVSHNGEATGRRVVKATKAGKALAGAPPWIYKTIDGNDRHPASLCGYKDLSASPTPHFYF